MLRKRSGAVGGKKVLMADHHLPSPTARCSRPTASSSSLFLSPRLYVGGLSGKSFTDSEAAMSPTSILEAKSFSSSAISLLSDRNSFKSTSEPTAAPPPPSGIGLAIVDALGEEKSRRILLGSQLKIQIPSLLTFPESSSSPIEFGIKTKEFLLSSLSPSWKSPMASGNTLASESSSSPRVIAGSISMAGMELSEDYTCVITHGPNPRMTHIFDDYIVESSCDDLLVAPQRKATFLSFCHSCKKGLAQGSDTFMYR